MQGGRRRPHLKAAGVGSGWLCLGETGTFTHSKSPAERPTPYLWLTSRRKSRTRTRARTGSPTTPLLSGAHRCGNCASLTPFRRPEPLQVGLVSEPLRSTRAQADGGAGPGRQGRGALGKQAVEETQGGPGAASCAVQIQVPSLCHSTAQLTWVGVILSVTWPCQIHRPQKERGPHPTCKG